MDRLEPHTLTPQQRVARAVLLRLPVEIVHRVWGFVLDRDDSYESFNEVLECVPELSWSIEVVTDDPGLCPWMPCLRQFASSGLRPPRILDTTEHELEMKSQSNFGRLIRRVFVSFHCHIAVLRGELTAYEGCLYARLFLSRSIDASFCMLPERELEDRDGDYVYELLLRLQMRLGKYSSRKICIVGYIARDTDKSAYPNTNIDISRGQPQGLTTTLRYTPTGEVRDYRVSFSERCISEYDFHSTNYHDCSNPMVILNHEQLAQRVHISFKGSKVPQAHFYPELTPAKLKELKSYENSTFSIANLSWSFSNPQGAPVCIHGLSHGLYDQVCCNLVTSNCAPKLSVARLYKRIWYYGIPFDILCQTSATTPCFEELVWFRLSPTALPYPHECWGWFYVPSLTRLAIFSELRELYQDYWSIPGFLGSRDMECVQLVALEKSDVPWMLDLMLPDEHLRSLMSLELLQLRNSSGEDTTDTRDQPPFVEIDWDHLSFVTSLVQQLTIGGYIPAFALPRDPLANNEARVFMSLSRLCLDVSTITTARATCEYTWYELCLPGSHFPSLAHLYLKGVKSMPSNSYPKLSLTKTCTNLYLSSVITTKAMVNDKVLDIPIIPVVADTFNSWLRCRATAEFVYSGAAYDMGFTRRIEEVDEALRPI